MASYVPVGKKQLPKSRNPQTADSKFWRKFKSRVAEEQISAVTDVHFCPAPPHDFAVTSSTRVVVYDGVTCQVKKTISKFKDLAYSGCFRVDGELIAAGGETGAIKVFSTASRTTLKELKGHSRAVRWVRYSESDKLHLLSGSDDNTVRWWDVATENVVAKFDEHKDYVRCGSYNLASPDTWATGSYDHTVRIWDVRAAKSVCELQHGKPLEDVLFFPSGGLLATAGGNMVKIWDIVGGKLLKVLGNFQKTVTTLTLANPSNTGSVLVDDESPRLLTGSLDGHFKVFDTSEFKVVYTAKYPAPIFSMSVSPSCNTLAVGTATGLLSVRQRKEDEKLALVETEAEAFPFTIQRQATKQLRPSNKRYFTRGPAEKPADDDYVLSHTRKPTRGEHDKLLLKFQYKEALVAALKPGDPTVVVAVMEELVARKGLLQTFANLEVEELGMLLRFLAKYVILPKHSRFLVPITLSVLDNCATKFGDLKPEVQALKEKIQEEVKLQEALQSFQGMLQVLIQG